MLLESRALVTFLWVELRVSSPHPRTFSFPELSFAYTLWFEFYLTLFEVQFCPGTLVRKFSCVYSSLFLLCFNPCYSFILTHVLGVFCFFFFLLQECKFSGSFVFNHLQLWTLESCHFSHLSCWRYLNRGSCCTPKFTLLI